MKKLALSAVSLAALTTSVFAADLPSHKAPVVAPPPPMWTGFHVGINAGGTWANNQNLNVTTWNTSSTLGREADLDSAAFLSGAVPTSVASGFIGGGQIGYDWQVGVGGYGFVAGVEADIQGIAGSGGSGERTFLTESIRFTVPGFGTFDDDTINNQKATANLSYIGTVRGRIGFLATPTLLVYGTGGLAYGGVNMSLQNYQPSYINHDRGTFSGLAGVVAGYQSYSNTQVGYTAGGGLEWMAMPNWSIKAEYLYYDLGNASATAVNTLYPSAGRGLITEIQNVSNFSTRFNGNIVRAGVNYHFNFASAPVVAKY